MFFIFLTSGLFLGWSLGANDAANVYGTAVGTRMIKFKTAAIFCGIFVILGAVIGGAGASHTLGKLGAVNALAGSFTVALAAAITVTWMTKLKLPVSTSQAIVGAIIGWNFFSGFLTDYGSLTKIVSSWVLCPILSAFFAVIIFKLTQFIMNHIKVRLLFVDAYTRFGLLVVGAFASYSLGANNIANVVGVFVPSAPFDELNVYGLFTLTGAQQLFFLGAVAIAIGVFTYSKKVMLTVGGDLFKLSPIAALIVVLSQAIVLFLFSSEQLEHWLYTHNLPTIPLVPVSSSQAVIGAVIGIGLVKGGRNIQFKVLGKIASGWVSTPIIAGIISFVFLFFIQNVFQQEVSKVVYYKITPKVITKLVSKKLYKKDIKKFIGKKYDRASGIYDDLKTLSYERTKIEKIVEYSKITPIYIDPVLFLKIDKDIFTEKQLLSIKKLFKKRFNYLWELQDALSKFDKSWEYRAKTIENKLYNKDVKVKLQYIYQTFKKD